MADTDKLEKLQADWQRKHLETFAAELKILKFYLDKDPSRIDLQRRLQVVEVALGLQAAPAPMRGLKGEEASQTNHDFQADASEMEARSRWVEQELDFIPIMERARAYTMTSVERMFAMHKAVRYIEEAKIEGAIVECGVWRGGSIMVGIGTLLSLNSIGREIFLFDTFEGLPKPDPILDIDIWGNKGHDGWILESRGPEASNWAYASLEDVRSNVIGLGYPERFIHFVKGMVERTIPERSPDKIALLRLDTDWHASTKHALEQLFPALVPGGVLIMDDYGHFGGARKAADDYFNSHDVRILLARIDYSGRIGIKS